MVVACGSAAVESLTTIKDTWMFDQVSKRLANTLIRRLTLLSGACKQIIAKVTNSLLTSPNTQPKTMQRIKRGGRTNFWLGLSIP